MTDSGADITSLQAVAQRVKPYRAVLALVVILGVAAWFIAPLDVKKHVLAPRDESAKFEVTAGHTITQTFTARSGLKEVAIPLMYTRERGPVVVEVRDVDTQTILRAIEQEADGAQLTFPFAPIRGSFKKLSWSLNVPAGSSHAVAVFRESDRTSFPEGTSWYQTKQLQGNFAFSYIAEQPRYASYLERLVRTEPNASESVRASAQTVQEQLVLLATNIAHSWETHAVLLGLVGGFVLYWLYRMVLRRASFGVLVGILVGVSVLAHLYFAQTLPIINDEGAYVQDVLQSNGTFLPFRDFLSKGPLYLILLKAWHAIVPHSYADWRLLSAAAWGVSIILAANVARQLQLPKGAALIAAAALALLPAATVLTSPILLQPVAVVFVLAAFAALLKGVTENSARWIIIAAILTLAAYFVRASAIATIVPLLGVIALYGTRRLSRGTLFLAVLGAGAALIALVSLATMGRASTLVLFNFEALAVAAERQAVPTQAGEPIVRQLIENLRTFWSAAPWLIFGLVTATLSWVVSWRQWGVRILGLVLIGVLIRISYMNLADMDFLEPGRMYFNRILLLTIVVALPLMHAAIRYQRKEEKKVEWKHMSIVALWLVSLGALYAQWGNFIQSYLIEFIPPLAVLAGWGVYELFVASSRLLSWRRVVAQVSLACLFTVSTVYGYSVVNRWPPVGNMSHEALTEIAELVSSHTKANESIFTAQAAVTALANRPIVFGYSHSGWYLYERQGTLPTALRQVYFVDPKVVTEHLAEEVTTIVTDRRTRQVYFDDYPERQRILREQFTQVATVENPETDSDFVLYRRNVESQE